jgi:hypothetical protein
MPVVEMLNGSAIIFEQLDTRAKQFLIPPWMPGNRTADPSAAFRSLRELHSARDDKSETTRHNPN